MKPRPAFQRRAAHRQRKAYGRALHQILTVRRQWLHVWRESIRAGGRRPARIKVPKMLQHRKVDLYRAFMAR